jgi:hypothetical protein
MLIPDHTNTDHRTLINAIMQEFLTFGEEQMNHDLEIFNIPAEIFIRISPKTDDMKGTSGPPAILSHNTCASSGCLYALVSLMKLQMSSWFVMEDVS